MVRAGAARETLDTWVAEQRAAVGADPRWPAGEPVAGYRLAVADAPGRPWDGWGVAVVGRALTAVEQGRPAPVFLTPAPTEAEPDRRLGIQVWALRVGPPGSPAWAELWWRPPDEAVRVGVWSTARIKPAFAGRLHDAGAALSTRLLRRSGPRGRAEQEIYTRLCDAWRAVAARERPTHVLLASAVGRTPRTVGRWLARLEDAGYDFPPISADPN